MTEPRAGAVALVEGALGADDRVLVTGAGGWFGRELAALLSAADRTAMYVTRTPRAIPIGVGDSSPTVAAVGWDTSVIRDFAPTVVVDCAFVLRDYIPDATLEDYVLANTELTGRLLQLAQLESVRLAVTVSSGAAVHPVDASTVDVELNPYGYLKRQAELALLGLARPGRQVVVARPWSLSGALVTRPERYAFADLIRQARGGRMAIRASHPVERRYVGVDDFFAVVLASAGPVPVEIDSAGELVEVGELAERIQRVLGTDVPVDRPVFDEGPADDYYTRNGSWESACGALGFVAAGIDDQIVRVDAALSR